MNTAQMLMAAHLLRGYGCMSGMEEGWCVHETNLKLNDFVSFVCNLHDNNYNDARQKRHRQRRIKELTTTSATAVRADALDCVRGSM